MDDTTPQPTPTEPAFVSDPTPMVPPQRTSGPPAQWNAGLPSYPVYTAPPPSAAPQQGSVQKVIGIVLIVAFANVFLGVLFTILRTALAMNQMFP